MTISAEKILQRAQELDIAIWVEDEKIKCRGHGAIPPKMVEVIRAHKIELINYLQSLLPDIPKESALCYACLNEGTETPAHFAGPEDLMYCQPHYNALPSDWYQNETERIAEAYRQALPGWEVTVEPQCALAGHFKRLQDRDQENRRDYWTETQARLKQQGYYEQVARDEEHFRQQVARPRAYPSPFPAYAQVTIDGVKTLQIVGMWHTTENRLMTEGEL